MPEYDFYFIAGLGFAVLAMYIICIAISIICLVVSIRAMIKLKKNTDESKKSLYRGLSLLILVPIGVIIYFIGQFLPIYLKQKQNNEYLANIPHIKVIDKEDAWINGFDLDNKHIVYVESQSWNTNYEDTKNKVSTKPYFDNIEFDGYIDYNGNITDVNNRKPYAILECNGKEYEIWKLNTTSEYNIYNIDTLNLPNTALGIHGSYFIDSQFITDYNINYDDMLINLYNYEYIESTTEESIIEDNMNTDLPEIELATAGDTNAKDTEVEENTTEEYVYYDIDYTDNIADKLTINNFIFYQISFKGNDTDESIVRHFDSREDWITTDGVTKDEIAVAMEIDVFGTITNKDNEELALHRIIYEGENTELYEFFHNYIVLQTEYKQDGEQYKYFIESKFYEEN